MRSLRGCLTGLVIVVALSLSAGTASAPAEHRLTIGDGQYLLDGIFT